MFRLGSRSKSPRRAAAAMYNSANQGVVSSTGNPGSPTSTAAGQDPQHLQRPFSSWSSAESYSSNSSGSLHRPGPLQKGAGRHNNSKDYNKRPLSPTASISTVTTSTSSMTRSTRSLLGRGRKQSATSVNEEFDPTTFRKNRSRPALGARGHDAIYDEYNDLFEEEEDDDEDLFGDRVGAEGLSRIDGGDGKGQDGSFFLLQVADSTPVAARNAANGRREHGSNDISPKTRRPANLAPITIANPPHEAILTITPPAPPTPPPKSWRPILTTTPPRSTAPSVEETMDAPSAPIFAPPTPPPKSAPLSIDTEFSNASYRMGDRMGAQTSDLSYSSSHRTAPSAPATRTKHPFGERVSSKGIKQTRSIPEGLGVSIPSPTLFAATPGAWPDRSSAYAPTSHPVQLPTSSNSDVFPQDPTQKKIIPNMRYSDTDIEGVKPVVPLKLRQSSSKPEFYRPPMEAVVAVVNIKSVDDNDGDCDAKGIAAETEKSIDDLLETLSSENRRSRQRSIARKLSLSGELALSRATTPEPGLEVSVSAFERSGTVKRTSHGDSSSSNGNGTHQRNASEEMAVEDAKDTDPAYLRAFREFVNASADNDAFVSRAPRFDAIQAHRICTRLREEYPLQVNTLPKERQPSEAKVRSRSNSKARLREAGEEIMTSLWALMASRWLSFGKMLISPAHEMMVASSAKQLSKRATVRFDGRAAQMLAEAGSRPSVSMEKEKRRILDLGGMPVADWGWHCAVDYPKVKVFTVTQRPLTATTTAASPEIPPVAAPPHFRGPKNHRHLTIDRLYRLPFPDNYFDVVSTRTLFLILKSSAPSRSPSRTLDEYDRCLAECIRVLKPGGYLEFMVLDSDVINAGPLASDLFARFSAALQSSGRDPEPTKRWISRLNSAGFTDIKRAWTFMPLAPPVSKPKVPTKDNSDIEAVPPRPGSDSHDPEVIAEQVRRRMQTWEDVGVKGSTKDVAAVTGLLGGWVWEKWLRAAGIADEGILGNVIEEAKERGSGLRKLVGYARKPSL